MWDIKFLRGCLECLTKANFRPLSSSIGWGRERKGPIPFRFKDMWLREEGFRDTLQAWWERLGLRGLTSFKFCSALVFVEEVGGGEVRVLC